MVEKAEFVKKAAVIQVPALVSCSRTLALPYSCQAEGDTEAAELLANAFAKVNVFHFHRVDSFCIP